MNYNCNDYQFQNLDPESRLALTRRTFLARAAAGIGMAALGSLLNERLFAAVTKAPATSATGGLPGLPHFAPKAKRIIYLHQSGAPAQMDLFDYKPKLAEFRGQDLPAQRRSEPSHPRP